MAGESHSAVAERFGLRPARLVAAGPGYDATTTLWNAAVTTRPALVARCRDTADVQAAVRAARSLGMPLSVRAGGHDWAGRGLVAGGLTIDVTGMTAVAVDPDTRTARVGAGVRMTALAEAAHPAGLVPVTGDIGSVGLLGLLLGGGYGPLVGRFGLACDNLLAARLVTADGDVVEVDEEHEPDLLWALRGGGGNLGVVTSAVVALHATGPVYTGLIGYPWSQAADVLTRLADAVDGLPDELSVHTVLTTGPDGDQAVLVAPTWSGAPGRGPGAVAPLSRLGDPSTTQLGLVPYHRMIGDAAARVPVGRHARLRTRNLPGLTPGAVATMVAACGDLPTALSGISLHTFHGAGTRLRDAAFGERRPHQMANILAMWEPGAAGDAAAWADRTHAALAPHALPGGYVNVLGPDDTEQAEQAYGANAARLLEIKARVDPDGVFRATPLPRVGAAPGAVRS